MYVNNKHNAIGASRIRLTFHSKDRSMERLGIESDQQLRTMAASARNKGYNIDALTIRNYQQLGVSYEELVSVKRQFRTRTNSERIYLHKGFVWVFAGKDACVLKTVIKLRIIPIKKEKVKEN